MVFSPSALAASRTSAGAAERQRGHLKQAVTRLVRLDQNAFAGLLLIRQYQAGMGPAEAREPRR
jgi:hypothetical protein